jgi:hypothetical protein
MRMNVPHPAFRVMPPTPVPSPTLTDIAIVLRTVLDNQTAILADLARIKAALPAVAVCSIEVGLDLAPSINVSNRVFADGLSVLSMISNRLA